MSCRKRIIAKRGSITTTSSGTPVVVALSQTSLTMPVIVRTSPSRSRVSLASLETMSSGFTAMPGGT